MQGLSLVELLPAAVGIALNPPAVVAAILMLSSAHPRRNALSFVLGWMAGLFLVGAVVLLAGDAIGMQGGPSKTALFVRLVLGLLLVVLAVRQWRSHRTASPEQEMPGWMRSIESFSGPKAFAAALVFAAFNPKTLALNIAGVVDITEAQLTALAEWAALAVFVALASITVALPVIYYLVAPRRSQPALDSSKRWLIANNAAVTATVLLVLGVMLIGAGVQGLVAL